MDEAGVLLELVKAYSPSGREEPGVRAFLRVAESLGFARAEIDEAGNGIARIGSGRPQIVFLGHIDTVEGELPVRVEGERVYGRGATDAKGALAAALLAARNHAAAGEIVVVAAVGEETDSRGARRLIPTMKPDCLIVGEPSSWSGVTVGYKGNLSLSLTFEGGRSHLSSPEATTVETALAFLDRFKEFCAARKGLTPFASLTAKVHTINSARSGGKEVVKVGLNVRLPPGVTAAEVLRFFDENGLAGRYKVVDSSEAVEVDTRNDVVRGLLAGIRAVGGRPTLVRKSGTSDMNLAVPAWGCPAAAYGPGDSHLDHTDEESMDVQELRKAVRVLEDAFLFLAEAKPA